MFEKLLILIHNHREIGTKYFDEQFEKVEKTSGKHAAHVRAIGRPLQKSSTSEPTHRIALRYSTGA